jgi:hypothetical protein
VKKMNIFYLIAGENSDLHTSWSPWNTRWWTRPAWCTRIHLAGRSASGGGAPGLGPATRQRFPGEPESQTRAEVRHTWHRSHSCSIFSRIGQALIFDAGTALFRGLFW